jgi:NADH-ubiquinone oxidoreductase chain 2
MLVNDLMVLFIVIELQSYSLYLITSAYNSSSNSVKSGLYYFIVGSIGSFIILDGTVSIYEEIGLTNI